MPQRTSVRRRLTGGLPPAALAVVAALAALLSAAQASWAQSSPLYGYQTRSTGDRFQRLLVDVDRAPGVEREALGAPDGTRGAPTDPAFDPACVTNPDSDPACITNPDHDPLCAVPTDPEYIPECSTNPAFDPACCDPWESFEVQIQIVDPGLEPTLELQWPPYPVAGSYRIYGRPEVGGWSLLAEVAGTSWTVTLPYADGRRVSSLRVTAVCGDDGGSSAAPPATPLPAFDPDRPRP